MIGQKIGETYELLRLIGQGAMGSVYEAKHGDTGRHVAVKLITDEAARDAKLVGRFEREAQTTAKLLSPHVVEILGSGRDSVTGHPYLVMELLGGENVEQLLARCGRLDPELAVRIGAQACLGLQKAHQAGVVHRDIKPSNLFLARGSGDEVVLKLLDFAVGSLKMEHARATGNESLVRSGSVIGSPIYMSPEQARALKSIDHRTDVWSLGMVLHELLTGKACHHDARGLGDLIIAICAEEPAPVHELMPAVPPPVSDAIAGALRLAVEQRYADAQKMLTALEALAPGGRRITASMLKPSLSASPDASPIASIFDGTPAMDAAGDDPTRASAKSEAAPRLRSPSSPGVAVEVAKDGPTVSSPIEALVLSAAAPLGAAQSAPPHGERDEGLFGPASVAVEEPPPDPAKRAASARAGLLGSSASRVVLAVGVGLLAGLAGTLGYGFAFPPEAGSAPATPPARADGAPSATGIEKPAPSNEPSAAPSATVSAAPAEVTVQVRIKPPLGTVTVDGEQAALKDGKIEITGPLDSAHEVVIKVGARTITKQVVLAAAGPEPAEIAVPVGGGGGRLPKGKLPDIYE